jgi:hypothetical protein
MIDAGEFSATLPRMTASDERFLAAIAAFDRQNARDPHRELGRPRELVQAERLSAWIEALAPDASEALRLAARCQHLRRWEIARTEFPEGRVGYLKWRTELARFHAEEAAKILREVGYDRETIDRVRKINGKQGLRSDPDVQAMEDALCLSFLEHELDAFSAKHSDDKVVDILAKTWKKMSPRGHAAALELVPNLPARIRGLIERAVSATGVP